MFRDLDTLRSAGVPLVFNEQFERYHIPSTFFLPPTNFTPEEALAVIVLCNELGADGQLPFYDAARSAALKLESSLPSRLRDELRLRTQAVRINLDKVSAAPECRSYYQQLVDAAAKRRAVRIRYDSFTDREVLCTKLSPYQVLFSRRSWYAIGRSSLHRQTRTFNIARITELEPLDDSFHIPRGFCIERYLRNAWHLIPEGGPDAEVEILFQPLVARNVAEVGWHKTQRTEFLPDGSLLFRATVSGLSEISWWALGYGDQAEVLRPLELRELVAERARRMVEHYESNGAPLPPTVSETPPAKSSPTPAPHFREAAKRRAEKSREGKIRGAKKHSSRKK